MKMPGILRLCIHDMRMQFRYGIYYGYAFVVAFYLLILVWLGEYFPSWIPGLIIFTDPSVLGFFFLGALMMLEKGENTRAALSITPLDPAQYFWSKTITLTMVSVLAVCTIAPFLHTDINWSLLLIAITLTSVQFIAIGVPAALHFKSVTSYLMGAAGFLTPVVAPAFIALMEPMPTWTIVIPAVSQFKLILVATGASEADWTVTAAMLVIATLAATASIWWALSRLNWVENA
jgi:fluoroquinolone transport system permease protein